jgi:hypothetical protein
MSAISPLRLAASLAAVALAAVAAPRAAQAQDIEACYARKSGSMYRINAADAPTACGNNGTKMTWPSKLPSGTITALQRVVDPSPPTIEAGQAAQFGAVCPTGKTALSAEWRIQALQSADGYTPQFADWTKMSIFQSFRTTASPAQWNMTAVNLSSKFPMKPILTVTCGIVTP